MMVLNLNPEAKFLWDTAKNSYGLKKDKFFQAALKDEFFPITAPFPPRGRFPAERGHHRPPY